MSSSYWISRSTVEATIPVVPKRTGLVRADGHAVRDDQGIHNYLGVTLFWAPYGMKHERDRILKHLDWLQTKGVDYIRILCECDWDGRSWSPAEWPDYQEIIAKTIDEAYDRGIRTQASLIGGQTADHMGVVNACIPVFKERIEKILYIEDVNEAARLDKATREQMAKMTQKLNAELPHLLGWSHPMGPWEEWSNEIKKSGGDLWILHTERDDADFHWRQVRQAYDFQAGAWTGSNQEGPGPQSSVDVMEEPLHLAMFRYLSHIMKCGFFTFHVGQGVTGKADANHGRPENMWEVPRIDEQFAALHMIEQFIPEGVQNWKVINNGRSDHPLPLDPAVSESHHENKNAGFWEGNAKYGSVNKNYVSAHQDGRFVGVLTGVNAWDGNARTLVGVSRYHMSVSAYNPVTGALVDTRRLAPSEQWTLPGRSDKQVGYIVVGKKG